MRKVLVLLASELERMAVENILRNDFEITTCQNSEDALRFLQNEYDAMILDLFMPEVDGLTFLMQNKSRCPAVIILMTQLVCADILMRAETLDVSVLLRKPCAMSTVHNHLMQQLRKEPLPCYWEGHGKPGGYSGVDYSKIHT